MSAPGPESEDFTEKEPDGPSHVDRAFAIEQRGAFHRGLSSKGKMALGLSPTHWGAYSRDEDPQLIDSFFCFLDLLGTRGIRSDQDAQAHLAATHRAMRNANELVAEVPGRWFSDNLGAYVPIVADLDAEVALQALVLEVASVQLALVAEGFAARGGIARGLFYGDDTFIHGPALERAYALETQRAVTPRIVLDEAAIAVATAPGSTAQAWLLRDDADRCVFVDYLHTVALRAGITSADTWFLDGLRAHQRTTQDALFRFDGVADVQEKYRWLAGYHNDAMRRLAPTIATLGATVDELLVTCSARAPTFTPLRTAD
jgi:hypothetical protein